MPWSGAGAFTRTDGTRSGADLAAQQKAAAVKVRADMHDNELEDFATGLENCITRNGENSASANLPMGNFKHTGVAATSGAASRTEYTSGGAAQDGAMMDAGDTAGSSTVYTATLSPAITAYANKQLFRVKFDEAFGATPTINFNSVGAKKMYYMVGSTATQLTTNNVPQNYVAILRYDTALDGAAGAFLLLNPPGVLAAPAEAAASDTVAGVQENAIQSEMETGTSTTLTVTPGRQHFHPGSAKYWIAFDGTGTPAAAASYNHASITDNGAGDYTLNIATDFSSAAFAAFALANASGGAATTCILSTKAAGSVRILVTLPGTGLVDVTDVNVLCFGDHA